LVKGGELAGVAITRVHLEEDTARSQHESGEGSLVDYNRAGVPLMELVTEPVIHDPKTAGNFARELQLLLRTLGVSDANMERGEMRVEANISISDTDKLGTKVEVKNLNSFKSVEDAIEYEVRRQVQLIEAGEKVVQETRGWDENKRKTFSQRLKETAHDYRYFPDPDLPKLDISKIDEFSVSRLSDELPLLPHERRTKYSNLGLSREQYEIVLANQELIQFFDSVLQQAGEDGDVIKLSLNYLTSDVMSLLSSEKSISDASAETLVQLMRMVVKGEITSRVAKDLLAEALFEHVDPKTLAESRGLLQNNSEDALVEVVRTIIAAHGNVVSDYRGGKAASLQFLVGQGMKATKGSANPQLLAELFKREIGT
jgi:aspartyl-tRNA(Asn)/glutamyl-tRNA(Gln) amidotransferase subunit B